MSRCVVISAGPVKDPALLSDLVQKDDYIIAADGGMELAAKLGVTPSVLVADFDSLPSVEPSNDVKVITLPAEKDVTDTEAAMNLGYEQGYRDFLLLGCTGGRLDHQQAAMATAAAYVKKGCDVVLADSQNEIYLLAPGSYFFPTTPGEKVSFFAYGGDVKGLFATDLYYDVTDMTLSPFDALCISNECVDEDTCIWFSDGLLLLYFSKD